MVNKYVLPLHMVISGETEIGEHKKHHLKIWFSEYCREKIGLEDGQ
jgi:hypothetical protein